MSVDRDRLPPLRAPTALSFPTIARERLPNGARLHAIDHPRRSLVSLLLLLRAGSAADPEGREGLAGLTADLLGEGCGPDPPLALHERLGDIGGRLGTDVFSDATVLSVTALARYTDEALRVLIDVATRPRFAAGDIDRVRSRRVSRIAQLRHSAAAVADRLFLQAVYGAHPYGHLPIGTERALGAIDGADLRAFHARHYAPPAHWTVIAVGGRSGSRLQATVGDAVGRLARGRSPAAVQPGTDIPPDPSPPSPRLVFAPRPGAVQSEIRIGSLGVARNVNGYEALRVMDIVLGGQFTSRLNLNLREEKGYTYGVSSSFDARRGRGPFVVRTAVEATATVAAAREVLREIRDIGAGRPVTDDELDGARAALTRGFPRQFETAGQLARAAMRLALFDLPADEYVSFVPRVARVGRDDVTAAARRHLDPDRLVAAVVGPPDLEASLADLGFGEPITMPS